MEVNDWPVGLSDSQIFYNHTVWTKTPQPPPLDSYWLNQQQRPYHSTYRPFMGSNALHYHTNRLHDVNDSIDVLLSKIKSFFPTASNEHIKQLLEKYHYREAVVMSALQVEKHPLTTPTSYSSSLAAVKHAIAQITPHSSPIKVPSVVVKDTNRVKTEPPKLEEPPKLKEPPATARLKFRYLLNIFPGVEDVTILEALEKTKNNAFNATENLVDKGYIRRDRTSLPSRDAVEQVNRALTEARKKAKENKRIPPTRLAEKETARENDVENKKSVEGKAVGSDQAQNKKNVDAESSPTKNAEELRLLEAREKMKCALHCKFPHVPAEVIEFALEASSYNERRAECVLTTAYKNEIKRHFLNESQDLIETKEDLMRLAEKRICDIKIGDSIYLDTGTAQSTTVGSNTGSSYMTPSPIGSNSESSEKKTGLSLSPLPGYEEANESNIRCTPPRSLLVTNYLKDECDSFHTDQSIPTSEIIGHVKVSPSGANKNLLRRRSTLAKGPDPGNYKGPQKGLAKGSTVFGKIKKYVKTPSSTNSGEKSCIIM